MSIHLDANLDGQRDGQVERTRGKLMASIRRMPGITPAAGSSKSARFRGQ